MSRMADETTPLPIARNYHIIEVRRAPSRTSNIVSCCFTALFFCVFLSVFYNAFNHAGEPPWMHTPDAPEDHRPYFSPGFSGPHLSAANVPLEVHIMSKCPDAQVCLRDLVVPAMEDIADKVDFKLSYIASTHGNSNSSVDCMHGPGECLGNIIELCAAELYPDPKVHLGFTMCLTSEYSHIPEQPFVQQCALEHAIDFDRLNECVSRDNGQHGLELLAASARRSADAGVEKSCTVRLDGDIRCVRDGGAWKDCKAGSKPADLVRDVTNKAS